MTTPMTSTPNSDGPVQHGTLRSNNYRVPRNPACCECCKHVVWSPKYAEYVCGLVERTDDVTEYDTIVRPIGICDYYAEDV